MGVLLRHHHPQHRHHHLPTLLATFTLLFFVSVSASVSASPVYFTHLGVGSEQEREEGEGGRSSGRLLIQKRLGGPGSSPPTCRSKCGGCAPCKPVHLPIQPGFSMPLEYYPEAWRCKCGDKLFMP